MTSTASHPRDRHVPLKPVVFQILLALAEGASHGYGLALAVRRQSGGRIHLKTGPLYRHLKRLLDDGLIEDLAGPANADRRRGAYYQLTRFGREVVAEEGQRLAELVSRTHDLGLLGEERGV